MIVMNIRWLATAVAACLLLGACATASTSAPDGKLKVVTAFYPLEFAARQVGGDAVEVSTLTPPGVEPHDLELSPSQVAEIRDADVIVYIPGFQPAVDTAIEQQAQDRAVDAAKGITLLAAPQAQDTADKLTDPHIWLDPANMATIGATLADAFTTRSPQGGFSERNRDFAEHMTVLDQRFTAGLATCTIKDMVVSHEAFAYLAQAFGFTQVGISGLSPDAEPSPARLKEVADKVKADGVTTVYYETLVDPKVAETLAAETGTVAAVLDPLEGLAPGSTGDYTSVMLTNLDTLRAGQRCA